MRIKFSKMHGLGNDFVVIDAISQKVRLTPDKIRFIADRHFGIGCDQILLVEIPESSSVDFRYRIFNADGSEVENCGNGARCFARFVRDRKLTGKNIIRVETAGGIIELHVQADNQVSVNMGVPRLSPEQVPFTGENKTTIARAVAYPVLVAGKTLQISAVSMGNPHAVQVVENVKTADVETLGPLIENHPQFPARVNAGFMQIVSRDEINLRVYERGAGETLACGTGACAAVVAGRLRGLLNEKVKVNLPGGNLQIEWTDESSPVIMTGPAEFVFHGQIKL